MNLSILLRRAYKSAEKFSVIKLKTTFYKVLCLKLDAPSDYLPFVSSRTIKRRNNIEMGDADLDVEKTRAGIR